MSHRPIVIVVCGTRGKAKFRFVEENILSMTGGYEYVDVCSIARGLSPLAEPSRSSLIDAIELSDNLVFRLFLSKKSFAFECHALNRRTRGIIRQAKRKGYRVRFVDYEEALFLTLIDQDIENNPQDIEPITLEMASEIQELVDGVDLD